MKFKYFLQYHVGADWLFDMEEYNEFMCEEDYEVEEGGDPQPNDMNMGQEEYAACQVRLSILPVRVNFLYPGQGGSNRRVGRVKRVKNQQPNYA